MNESTLGANLRSLYGIDAVPSDTSVRETLDLVKPESLRPAFKELFKPLQRGKILQQYQYLDGKVLISIDGTQYFTSKTVHCDCCMTKVSKKSGDTTYYHQMLAAVIISPDEKAVIPLCPEPIFKQDGANKNDCERNAAARWVDGFRTDHPKLAAIVVEDGLASNGPHIRKLMENDLSFILGAKPGDHKALFEDFGLRGDVEYLTISEAGKTLEYSFVNNIALNEANQDLLVNFLIVTEKSSDKTTTFSFVTDIEITKDNIQKIAKGGRARWKVENETFNTLKNQGYNFEHNFGHGKENLSVVFAFLMMLAFAVDQIQRLASEAFNKALEAKRGRPKYLWEAIRSKVNEYLVPNWASLFHAIANGILPQTLPDTT